MINNLSLLIKNFAKKIPDQDAIVTLRKSRYGHEVTDVRMTFSELDVKINQFAEQFSQKGIDKSSRVLMLLRPGIEMIASFFALVRLGAIPILIDPGIGIFDFIRLSNFSKPDAILCEGWIRYAIIFKLIPIHCPKDRIIAVNKNFASKQKSSEISINMSPEDTVAILFTSGSTGCAKGVVYQHKNFESQFHVLKETYNLQPGARDFTLLPAFMLFNPVFGRTTIIPNINFSKPRKLSAKRVVESIINNGATSSFGSPVLWGKIANYCTSNGIKLQTLENIFLAGVSATIPTLERIRAIAPNAEIHTPYGATEALPITTITATEILDEIRPLQENGAGTCVGKPVEGINVAIIKRTDQAVTKLDDDNLLSLGFFGEIIVSGNHVTESYDQLVEKTKLAKIDASGKIWHRMGDIGFFDEKDRLWFCGRKAEIVETQDGTVYYPDCVEPLFCKHKAVERCAIIAVTKNGEILPAVVILPKRHHYPTFFWQKWTFRRQLKKLAKQFPKTRTIKTFYFCRSLPVDPRHNSKIHRLELGKKFSK